MLTSTTHLKCPECGKQFASGTADQGVICPNCGQRFSPDQLPLDRDIVRPRGQEAPPDPRRTMPK